jgi:hypothetical protein
MNLVWGNSLKVLVFHFSLGGTQGIDIFVHATPEENQGSGGEDRPEACAIAAVSAPGRLLLRCNPATNRQSKKGLRKFTHHQVISIVL